MDLSHLSLKELAMVIGKVFKEHNIDSTLVGGACVSIYSENKYQSYDLDYVTYENAKTIGRVLSELGFYSRGRYFVHNQTSFYIDLVTPPVAIGKSPIKKFNSLRSSIGEIKLLSPTDCVKDRLAGFYHWNDIQALEQAVLVFKDQKIDIDELEKWSANENCLEKFQIFLKKIKK
jgi:hypothetical protein